MKYDGIQNKNRFICDMKHQGLYSLCKHVRHLFNDWLMPVLFLESLYAAAFSEDQIHLRIYVNIHSSPT